MDDREKRENSFSFSFSLDSDDIGDLFLSVPHVTIGCYALMQVILKREKRLSHMSLVLRGIV